MAPRAVAKKALLLYLLGLASWVGTQAAEQIFTFPPLTEGLYTRYAANTIPDGALAEALNVVLDEDVPGVVVARKGYAKYNATAITNAQSVRGLWAFDATDRTRYMVAFSSAAFYRTSGDGAWTAITGASGYSSTVDFDAVSTLGKFWATNGVTGFYWDGTSTKTVSGMPAGTLIDRFRNRVLVSGITGSRSTLRGSGELDGEDYTLVADPIGVVISSTPFQIRFGGSNDGQEITCLMGVYQDVFLVGKRDSLWGLYGFDRRDFAVRELSREVGCLEDRSVQEKNGCLYWLSKRGVEKLCGGQIERVSDPIRDRIDTIIATAGNPQSRTDTTQTDFEAGDLSASGPGARMSSTITPGSVVPSSWSRTEDTGLNFSTGTLINVSTISGAFDLIQGAAAAFTNAGAESSSTTLNWSSNVSYSTVTDSGLFASVIWSDGGGKTCPVSLRIRLLDASLNVLYSSTTSITDGLASTALTFDTSTQTTRSLIIDIRSVGSGAGIAQTAQSVAFIRGTGASFKYKDSDSSSSCGAGWDVDESSLVTSGTYHTARFDVGLTTPTYGTFSATSVSSPTSTSLVFGTRVAATSSAALDAAVTVTPGDKIGSAQKQYIVAVASFSVNATTNTAPSFVSAGLQASTTGHFIGQCRNPETTITSWGTLSCGVVNNSGSHTFAISTGTTCHGVTRSTATWTTQANNTIITVATASFVAYRDLFDIDSGTETPTLQDCTINWNAGATRPPVSSAVYRDRYHLAYTSSTASGAANDHEMVLDSRDKWTLFDNHDCYALNLYERKLYCGASTASGQVWQQDIGTDDDGTAITSRIKTKAFHLGYPQARKSFGRLYLDLEPAPDASDNIDLTATYYVDRGTTSFALSSVDLNEDPGYILTTEFPFPLTDKVDARYIQFGLESSALNSPWRLYQGRLYFNTLDPD